MCSDCFEDTDQVSTNVPTASTEPASASDVEPTPNPGWSRRNFLKAAALGAAAAALVGKDSGGRLRIGALSAYADDLSALQCTANDVRIKGPGKILNEPCNCPPGTTFDAQVQFTVENNAAAERFCVTLHLCPVKLADGSTFNPGDVIINNGKPIPGKSSNTYTATIKNYPCNAGLLCFGEAGSEEFGVFPKGAECPTGKCCSTISYNVKASDPCPDTTRQIASKCRHQQICIQGRSVDLTCIDDPNDTADTCSPTCGGTATLRLCGTGEAPLKFALKDDAGNTYTPTSTSGGCATYKVTVTKTTTFTGTVTDNTGCANSDNHTLTVTPIAVTSASGTPPTCAGGNTTLKACASGGGTITYEFFEGTTSLGDVDSSTGCGELSVLLGPGEHTIKVVASNAAGCSDDETFKVTVPQPVKADLGLTGDGNCDGKLTFKATVSGGTAPYTITFSVDGVAKQTGASDTFLYGPVLDGTCHTIKVSAVDSNDCPSSPTTPGGDTISVAQCVTTTQCTPPSTP